MKPRLEREKRVVEQMLRLYCRSKHSDKRSGNGGDELCPDCQSLLEYARRRLDHCQWGDAKPTCKHCPVHCYAPDRRERIRTVMRWAGPRMLLHHPIEVIRHLWGKE